MAQRPFGVAAVKREGHLVRSVYSCIQLLENYLGSYNYLMAKVITTSVVAGNRPGNSRCGVYLVDFDAQQVRQVLDWVGNTRDRRADQHDRGPRGIAIDDEIVYIVASDELFAFGTNFKLIDSWRNPYLSHVDEMSIYERTLYIVSAGYDSILAFDLDKKRFFWALHIDLDRYSFQESVYDPMGDGGPLLLNKLKLNNVHTNDNGMYICGAKSGGMLHFNGETVYMAITLPEGTYNAQPYRDGVLFHDSQANAVRYASRSGQEDRAIRVSYDDPVNQENKGSHDIGATQQGFSRGLALLNDRVVAAGSSPSTITLYDLQESNKLLSVSLSTDIDNSIHGIELWPF